MSIRSALSLIEPALAALGVDDVPGLQIADAARWGTLHHPLLNPDLPALLIDLDQIDLAQIKRVLLNQYPGEHPIQVRAARGNGRKAGTRRPRPDSLRWAARR